MGALGRVDSNGTHVFADRADDHTVGEMDDTEINALNPEAFERMLHDRWAVSRRDIYVGAILPPRSLDASQPTRPPQALRRLKMSQAALVAVLATGRLPRPGRLGSGEVAWRKDEVEALISLNEM